MDNNLVLALAFFLTSALLLPIGLGMDGGLLTIIESDPNTVEVGSYHFSLTSSRQVWDQQRISVQENHDLTATLKVKVVMGESNANPYLTKLVVYPEGWYQGSVDLPDDEPILDLTDVGEGEYSETFEMYTMHRQEFEVLAEKISDVVDCSSGECIKQSSEFTIDVSVEYTSIEVEDPYDESDVPDGYYVWYRNGRFRLEFNRATGHWHCVDVDRDVLLNTVLEDLQPAKEWIDDYYGYDDEGYFDFESGSSSEPEITRTFVKTYEGYDIYKVEGDGDTYYTVSDNTITRDSLDALEERIDEIVALQTEQWLYKGYLIEWREGEFSVYLSEDGEKGDFVEGGFSTKPEAEEYIDSLVDTEAPSSTAGSNAMFLVASVICAIMGIVFIRRKGELA